MATHVSELTPGKGERVITFGGTRAGKSSLTDMTMRQVQHERPACMQILVDTKPRYRAQFERHPFNSKARREAAHRYEAWEAGPTVPNSVVADIWDDHPFKGLWNEPGEIVILQGGEYDDWVRMLQLLKGFVAAQIKGRERRIIVDECLDFTSATHSALIRVMTCFTGLRERAGNAESESISERTGFTACRHSFLPWSAVSTCSISEQIATCVTCARSASKTPRVQRESTCSASTKSSLAELCQSHSRAGSHCRIGTWHNCQIRKRNGGRY